MPIHNVVGFTFQTCHHPDLVNLYGCTIGHGTRIGAFVEIGQGVVIGERCKVQTGAFIPPGVTIGNDCFIGPHVTFCNVKHPMRGEAIRPTKVCDGAVIGANATILPGVVIGKGAVVGAGQWWWRTLRMGRRWRGIRRGLWR